MMLFLTLAALAAIPASASASDCGVAIKNAAKTPKLPNLPVWSYYVDAAGKLPSGVLEGALKSPGAFDMCYSIPKYSYFPMDADEVKYALVTLNGTKLSASVAFNPVVGVCLPSPCAELGLAGVQEMLAALPLAVPANAVLAFDVVEFSTPLSGWAYVCILIMVTLCLLSVAGSAVTEGGLPGLFTLEKHNPKTDALWLRTLACFSLVQNTKTLCATEQRFPATAALEGMRVLSMQWVVIGHTIMFLAPTVDNIRFLPEVTGRFAMQPIINAFASVDTFFVISGFLLAFISVRKLRKLAAKHPSPGQYFGAVVLMVVHRWLRLVPALGVIMLASAELIPSVGNGPFWKGRAIGQPCRDFWWTNLLFINNFHPAELTDECIGQSWYLADDMQFFVVCMAVLVLFVAVPLLRNSLPLKLYILGFAAALCCIGRMVLTYGYNLKPTAFSTLCPGCSTVEDLSSTKRLGNSLYVQPQYRITPYLVGMMAGLLLDEINQRAGKQLAKASKALLGAREAVVTLEEGPYGEALLLDTKRNGEDQGEQSCLPVRGTSSGVGVTEYMPHDGEEEEAITRQVTVTSLMGLADTDGSGKAGGDKAESSASVIYGELPWLAGAAVALGVMVATLFGLYGAFHGHPLNMADNMMYNGLHKVAWALAISFFILAFALGHLPLVNTLLSMPIFMPLSKLSYSCYLIHITVLTVITGVARTESHYTDYFYVTLYFATLFTTYIAAALVFVLVEVPSARLEGIFLPRM